MATMALLALQNTSADPRLHRSLIESGVITAFVAFGEQPEGLHVNHPVLFQKMLEAWAEFYPDAVVAAGYDRRYGVDAVGHHARDEP